MDKLIEKIDSYNIFNYFVPGAIIFEFLRMLVGAEAVTDILTRILVYYLTGLTVSRIGSICLDWFLKLIRLVKHSDYDDYVRACDTDKKIELFVEIANMYRTIYVGALVCLIATFFVPMTQSFLDNVRETRLVLAGLIALFFLAYRKQSGYVNKRVALRSPTPASS
jgi:hypothetical protein